MPGIKRPIRPREIIDRDPEWRELTRIWDTNNSELVFVIGRRRVGKSFLLSRFAAAVGGLYYQATRRTAAAQLATLTRLVGEHFDDPALLEGISFPDWHACFSYLRRKAERSPFLVVLDEFPYLAAADPSLTSVLQSEWDQHLQETRIKILLSGSHISTMRQIEAVDQPLYGRRTARLAIAPFRYRQVADFVPSYKPLDWLRTYGLFGGIAGHLALLDPKVGLATNVGRLMLSPTGRLVDEAQHMLDAFLGDSDVHYSVIQAIAQGNHTWSGLTNRTGKTGGALLRPIQWLQEMQIARREVPISEKHPSRSKRPRYRITDPYVRFWHRCIAPLVSAGAIGLADPRLLWTERVAPQLDDIMGGVFEDVCRDFVRAGGGKDGVLPFEPIQVGAWWNHDGTEELNLVALGSRGALLVGECKWGTVVRADLRQLRRRAELVAADLGGVRSVHYMLFSGRGIGDADLREAVDAGEVMHRRADELF